MMVNTRSSAKDSHVVRFKDKVSVRRFLDFNSPADWKQSPEETYSLNEEYNDIDFIDKNEYDVNTSTRQPINDLADLIERNKRDMRQSTNKQTSNSMSNSMTQYKDVNVLDETILYENESWIPAICDTIIFVVLVSLFHTLANVTYNIFGWSFYLVIITAGIILFLYSITYFDSLEPGVVPPSPLSPAKFRRISGHTFHLNYVMSVVYGVAFFCVQNSMIFDRLAGRV